MSVEITGVPRFAIAFVRDGVLPAGADDACAEADGNIAVIGTGTENIDLALLPSAAAVFSLECAWTSCADVATTLVTQRAPQVVIVPSSPDGRDIAPRIAARCNYQFHAGAIAVHADTVELSRKGGRVVEEHRLGDHSVVTLIPGVRGASPFRGAPDFNVQTIESAPSRNDVVSVTVLDADAATIDLTEASRIVAGGQGLGDTAMFERLQRVGASLDAALGGTRVASDAGWIPFERQIGTTGVMVNPKLYLAFAISGATQHVSGLGDPDHIVSVNTDPSCPMMTMANLAIVSDAKAVIVELERQLGSL